jgi:phospholipase C
MRIGFFATALLASIAVGCARGGMSQGSDGSFVPGLRRLHHSGTPIAHVVIMIQENRSFDDFFATFPGATGATYGCAMASPVPDSSEREASEPRRCPRGDKVVKLKAGTLEGESLAHQYYGFKREYDRGRMDGFNLVTVQTERGIRVPAGLYAYQYVDPKYIAPYWSLAKTWVLADHMFTTQGSSSFTAHQDLIAGGTPIQVGSQVENVIDFPIPSSWGCDAKPGTVTSLITSTGAYRRGLGPYPCFSYETIRDLLDAKGLSWLYFTNTSPVGVWDAFEAIKSVRRGSEWKTHIIVPETDIFEYISNGELPAVSYVIPDAGTSDHPGPHGDRGPQWIASVVNAIGESAYWPSTLVVVLWDEWGGEYDNVPPPQLDGQGLGPRVPMLLISAYDKETSSGTPGYISHTQYEDGSVLKFIEENWNLGRLGTSDARANSIGDCFDFNQTPRPYIKVASSLSIGYFAHHYHVSSAPIDEY